MFPFRNGEATMVTSDGLADYRLMAFEVLYGAFVFFRRRTGRKGA